LPAAPAVSSGEEAPASESTLNPLPATLPSSGTVFSLDDGACTDWADYKRPDIYANHSPSDTNSDWDAWTWAEHARVEGLQVDAAPEVGAIAVWPISSGSPVGHVAYVETVGSGEGGGTVSVSEMNSLSGTEHSLVVEGVSYEYETETDSLAALEAAGVVFIHQR
jgi:surface antigen